MVVVGQVRVVSGCYARRRRRRGWVDGYGEALGSLLKKGKEEAAMIVVVVVVIHAIPCRGLRMMRWWCDGGWCRRCG